jgi:hypothetical protein
VGRIPASRVRIPPSPSLAEVTPRARVLTGETLFPPYRLVRRRRARCDRRFGPRGKRPGAARSSDSAFPAEEGGLVPSADCSGYPVPARPGSLGGVAERSNAAVSKTVSGGFVRRGFKSLPLRLTHGSPPRGEPWPFRLLSARRVPRKSSGVDDELISREELTATCFSDHRHPRQTRVRFCEPWRKTMAKPKKMIPEQHSERESRSAP